MSITPGTPVRLVGDHLGIPNNGFPHRVFEDGTQAVVEDDQDDYEFVTLTVTVEYQIKVRHGDFAPVDEASA